MKLLLPMSWGNFASQSDFLKGVSSLKIYKKVYKGAQLSSVIQIKFKQ